MGVNNLRWSGRDNGRTERQVYYDIYSKKKKCELFHSPLSAHLLVPVKASGLPEALPISAVSHQSRYH
jgi:hypothetical protein